MRHQIMPIAMGLIMGPMMLWMLHGALMGDGGNLVALVIFVGAHVLLLAVLIAAGWFAARLSPGLRAWMARVHRPSLRHFAIMLASAAIAAGTVHLFIHGIA